jgi:hypothetical protein
MGGFNQMGPGPGFMPGGPGGPGGPQTPLQQMRANFMASGGGPGPNFGNGGPNQGGPNPNNPGMMGGNGPMGANGPRFQNFQRFMPPLRAMMQNVRLLVCTLSVNIFSFDCI